jgi:hypothetical protein
MEEFQKRVIDEKRELDEKIHRLTIFIYDSLGFKDINEGEQGRLRVQLWIMKSYSAVLGERIKSFSCNEPPEIVIIMERA